MDKWVYGISGVLIGGVIGFPVGVYFGYKWSLREIKKVLPFVSTWDDVYAYMQGVGPDDRVTPPIYNLPRKTARPGRPRLRPSWATSRSPRTEKRPCGTRTR